MMLLRTLKDVLPNKPKRIPSPLGMELEEKIGWRNVCLLMLGQPGARVQDRTLNNSMGGSAGSGFSKSWPTPRPLAWPLSYTSSRESRCPPPAHPASLSALPPPLL